MFRPAVAGFINSKRYKMVLYNLCNGVLMNRSRHRYLVFYLWVLLCTSSLTHLFVFSPSPTGDDQAQ